MIIPHSRKIHEFALYTAKASEYRAGELTLKDPDMVHRIVTVLRVARGEGIILFNKEFHARFVCTQMSKKEVTGVLAAKEPNQRALPVVDVLLPLLKRESLEEAIYGITECGGDSIQLVMTERVQRKWQGLHDFERLKRIQIAAAEQSKHYTFPEIKEPIALKDALAQLRVPLMCADVEGQPYLQTDKEHVALLVGPEADFTDTERELIKEHNATLFKLTSTVLRAHQAATVSVAMIKTLGMYSKLLK